MQDGIQIRNLATYLSTLSSTLLASPIQEA